MSDNIQEWPKMLFHRETGKGKVFNSPEEVTAEYISRDEKEANKPVSFKQLKERAEVLGIKFKVGMSREKLEAAIAEKEKENRDVVE